MKKLILSAACFLASNLFAFHVLSASTNGAQLSPYLVKKLTIDFYSAGTIQVSPPGNELGMRLDFEQVWNVDRDFIDEYDAMDYIISHFCKADIDKVDQKLCGRPNGGTYSCITLQSGKAHVKIRYIKYFASTINEPKAYYLDCP